MNAELDNKENILKLPFYVINLERDREKLEKVREEFKVEGIKLTRFPAFLGCDYREHKDVHPILSVLGTDTMIGCGLSHRHIWKKMVQEKIPQAVILEDDTLPVSQFKDKLSQVLSEIPENYDLLYLHYNSFDGDLLTKQVSNSDSELSLYRIKSAASTVAYVCSLNGATKLLKLIDKLKFHIDAQITSKMYKLKAYAVKPFLVQTQFEETSNATSYLIHQPLPIFWQWFFGMTYARIPIIRRNVSVWASLVWPLMITLAYFIDWRFIILLLVLL